MSVKLWIILLGLKASRTRNSIRTKGMYADRVESGSRRSVKERLNGNLLTDSTRQHKITGKRQRQDDKWEHDLYEDDEPRLSNRKVTAQDLRLKLQKKGLHPGVQTGKDLREKLSGTMTSQPKIYDPPKPKVAVKPSSRSINVEAPAVHIKKPANPIPRKLSRKADQSVDEFLHSLGLGKYLLSFQAEEVDMTALNHMTDEDLKAMGIPMGPRKKILLALESKG
ncbi:hypothetical protein VNO77_19811 [Canavalia gladiata]|uniref:SAM domain-containing protein n=1 Tax=Canavalia gladiata TaxID=3824 RepID=A0AAN9LN70_CANGL